MSIFDAFSSREKKLENNSEKTNENKSVNKDDTEIINYCQKILNGITSVATDVYEIQNIIIYLQKQYQNIISSKNYDIKLDSSYYFMRTKLEKASNFIGKEILSEAFNFLQMSSHEKEVYITQNKEVSVPEFKPVNDGDLYDLGNLFKIQEQVVSEDDDIEFLSSEPEEKSDMNPSIDEPTVVLDSLPSDYNDEKIPKPEIASETESTFDVPEEDMQSIYDEQTAILDKIDLETPIPVIDTGADLPFVPDAPVVDEKENEEKISEDTSLQQNEFIPLESDDVASVGLDDIDKYIATARNQNDDEVSMDITPEPEVETYPNIGNIEVNQSLQPDDMDFANGENEVSVDNAYEPEVDQSPDINLDIEPTEDVVAEEEPDIKIVEAMDMADINSYIDSLTDGLAEEFAIPDESIGQEEATEEKSTVDKPLNEEKQKESLLNSIEHITFEQKLHNYEITKLDILKDLKQIEYSTFGAHSADEIEKRFPDDYQEYDKYRQKVKLLETKKYSKNLDKKIDELSFDIKVLNDALKVYQIYQKRYNEINNIKVDKLEKEENLRKIYNLLHAKENERLKDTGSLYDAWDLSDKKIPKEYQGKTYEEIEQMLKEKQNKKEAKEDAKIRESLTVKAIRKDLGVNDDYLLTDIQIKNLRKQFDRLSLDELKEFLGIMPDNLTAVQKENISAYEEQKKEDERKKQELIDNIIAIIYPNISDELVPIVRKPLEQYNVLELEDIERFYKNELREGTARS